MAGAPTRARAEIFHPRTALGLDIRKLGMWTMLGSESLFFTALIANFFVYRSSPVGEGLGPKDLDISLTGAGAFILLMSSLTMVLALAAIREGDNKRFRAWIVGTALLGSVFLGIQAFEFSSFALEGKGMGTNMFGAAFFALTGFHGTHVLLGVIWLFSLAAFNVGRHADPVAGTDGGAAMPVELCGLYWHFVDLVWVFIFTLVYLMPLG